MGLIDPATGKYSAETDMDTAVSDQVTRVSFCTSTAWMAEAIVSGGSSTEHSHISDSTINGILNNA